MEQFQLNQLSTKQIPLVLFVLWAACSEGASLDRDGQARAILFQLVAPEALPDHVIPTSGILIFRESAFQTINGQPVFPLIDFPISPGRSIQLKTEYLQGALGAQSLTAKARSPEFRWAGAITGDPNGRFVFTRTSADSLVGSIVLSNERWDLKPIEPDLYELQQMNSTSGRRTQSLLEPLTPDEVSASEVAEEPIQNSDMDLVPASNNQIDLLVLFTTSALKQDPQIEDEIRLAVAEANDSFTRQNINIRLNLVAALETAYSVDGRITKDVDLGRLQYDGDGYIDEVFDLRREHSADLVSLWVEGNAGTNRGQSYVMTTNSRQFRDWGFSIVSRHAARTYYSFIHEIGHNLGAGHEEDKTRLGNSQPTFAHAHGFSSTEARITTVMAYGFDCVDLRIKCERRLIWSDPGLKIGDQSFGNKYANNRAVLKRTSASVARYVNPQIAITRPIDINRSGVKTLDVGKVSDIAFKRVNPNLVQELDQPNSKIEFKLFGETVSFIPETRKALAPGIFQYSGVVHGADHPRMRMIVQTSGQVDFEAYIKSIRYVVEPFQNDTLRFAKYGESSVASIKVIQPSPERADPTIVDVLFAYTNATAENTSIGYQIQLAVEEANHTMRRSNVNGQLNAVASIRVNYVESGSFDTDLNRLVAENDNFLDEVHELRKEYGADIVALVLPTNLQCSQAAGIDVSPGEAFFVISTSCLEGYNTVAHSLGHLMGGRHEEQIDPTPSKARGYVDPSGEWYTIMSNGQSCKPTCQRLARYSNPNQEYDGRATGTRNANMVSLLNQNFPVFADFDRHL